MTESVTPTPSRKAPKRRFRWLLVLLLAVIGVPALGIFPKDGWFRQRAIRVDKVSGTQVIWIRGLFGESKIMQVDRSDLDKYLNAARIDWEPQWVVLSKTDYGLFTSTVFCGSLPPVAVLDKYTSYLRETLTEAEFKNLVNVLKNGNKAEQEREVNAIIKKCEKVADTRTRQ